MVDEIRERLSSISWWMRLLNQQIAQRANKEDEAQGRFWQDRFRSIRIDDEESLLACAAYVELNPIRAAIAETLEESEFTSIKRRIESEVASANNTPPVDSSETLDPVQTRRDAFLARLTIDERNNSIGPCPNGLGQRCSDKGFLSLSHSEYFELLDWTARQLAAGKRGRTPASTPPILQRLGLSRESWCSL
ncbi:MAG: hypothetical protein GY904_26905, partial [Planctomycetaceae bacterium]|nr:hypothetical protein [Planctomycetaceae bacterium]